MDSRFKCSFKNCKKHENHTAEYHHFSIEDLTKKDINFDVNEKPVSFYKRSLEPDELKNIYQSVFIYNLLYDFAKEYLPETQANQKLDQQITIHNGTKDTSTDTNVDKIKDKVIEFLFKNEKSDNLIEPEVKKNEVHNDESIGENIWNTDDINTLRRVFSEIKETNIKLKSKLISIEQENVQLKQKYEKLLDETKNLPNEKRELEANNERLYIRVVDLEREYNTFNSQLEDVDNENKRLKECLDNEKKLNQTISNEKLKLEFELRKFESELKSLKSDFNLKHTLIIEKIKFKYQSKIDKLEEKLKKLKIEFDEEKEAHEKTQNALKHLRSHFMAECLPVQQKPVKITDENIKIF